MAAVQFTECVLVRLVERNEYYPDLDASLILVAPVQTSSKQGQLKNCMRFLSLLIYVKEIRAKTIYP